MNTIHPIPFVRAQAIRSSWLHRSSALFLVLCALVWISAAAAQPLSEPPPACVTDSSRSGSRNSGFFLDLARPLSKWHVQFDEQRSVLALTWMTHVNGRPVWYATQPKLLAADGTLETPLYKQLRAPASAVQGEQRVVGRVALRWASSNAGSMGFRWRLDTEAASSAEYVTCLVAADGNDSASAAPGRFGRWATADTHNKTLKAEPGLLIGLTNLSKSSHDVQTVATLFDGAGEPVWLSAVATVPVGSWPDNQLKQGLMYVPGPARPDVPGTVSQPSVLAGALTLAAPADLAPHSLAVPGTAGAFVSAATGQSIQTATAGVERSLLLPQTTVLSLTLNASTCVVEGNPQQTVIEPPGNGILNLRTLWGQPHCQATLSWNKPAGEHVYLQNGIDAGFEVPATIGSQSGSASIQLTPSAGHYGFEVAPQLYGQYIQQNHLSYLWVSETEDAAAPGTGTWTAAALQAWNLNEGDWNAVPADMVRCRGFNNSTQQSSLYIGDNVPMRWRINGMGMSTLPTNQSPGHHLDSVDVQRRLVDPGTGSPVEQWRLTLHLPAKNGQPTWLQTGWITRQGQREFKGFLRHHTWNPTTRMRDAGVPVGLVAVQPFNYSASASSSNAGLGMRVRWRTVHAKLRTTPGNGHFGCLHPANDEPLNAERVNLPANSAYAGIWAGDHSGLARAQDAMAVYTLGPSSASEHHILRFWDGNNDPLALTATASRNSLELPAIEGAGSTALGLTAVLTTPETAVQQKLCSADVRRTSDNNKFYLQREFNLPGAPWWEGRFNYNLTGLRAKLRPDQGNCIGVTELDAINWNFPAVAENPGPLRTRLQGLFSPYLARLVVTPRTCTLLGAPGEACPVRLSFVGAAGLRVRRDSQIILPQTGTLSNIGVLNDAPNAAGLYCYTLVNSNNAAASDTSCVTVRDSTTPPPAIDCAKIVASNFDPSARCDSQTLPELTSVAAGASLKFKLLIPTAEVDTVRIEDAGGTHATILLSVDTSQPFTNKPVETGAFLATQTAGTYTFQIRSCRLGYCGPPTLRTLTVTGNIPAPPQDVSASSAYPELVSLNWNHSNTGGPVTFDIRRWDIDDVLQEERKDFTGAPQVFDVPAGTWRFGVRACRAGAGCSDWTRSTSQTIAASGLNPQASPGSSPTGVFTVNWQAIANTHHYELQTAAGEPAGSWSTPAVNLTTLNYLSAALPTGTHRFRVRGCLTAVLCGRYAETAAVVSTQGIPSNTTLPPAQSPAAPALPDQASILASSRVGSLDAAMRVSEAGQVEFSLPLLTAPGKGGVQPGMALSYSGSAATGLAGVGFNLSGLSAIARCRRSIESGDGPGPHPQVNFDLDDGNDAYCLDGQRLIQVGTGSESVDGTVHDYLEFRTEIESFQRVRAYAALAGATGLERVRGPRFWRVHGKDGSVREFGRDYPDLVTRSAVYANMPGSDAVRLLPRYSDDQSSPPQRFHHIVVWTISRSGDRLGNAIRYRYDTFWSNAQQADPYASHYLTRIFYTRHDGSAPIAHEHAVLVFDYEQTVGQVPAGWMAGSFSRQDLRLARIRSCLRGNSAIAITAAELDAAGTGVCDSAANVLRVYRLNYEVQSHIPEINTVSSGGHLVPGQYGSGRPRLASIQACADAAGQTCWAPTQLHWTNTRAQIQPWSEALGGYQFQRATGFKMGDVNDDGRPDVFWREALTDHQGDKIWLSLNQPFPTNGTRFGTPVSETRIADALDNDLYGNDPDRQWAVLDVNGDGRDDLITTESVNPDPDANVGPWNWYVRLAKSDGSGIESARTLLAGAPLGALTAEEAQFALTDTSGDGVVDLIFPRVVGSGSSARMILRMAQGSRNANGALQFAAATDVTLDFTNSGVATTCYRIGFGRRDRSDNWDGVDFDGDSGSDLLLRVQPLTSACTGRSSEQLPEGYEFGLDALEPPQRNAKLPNSASNPAAANAQWGLFASVNGSSFRLLTPLMHAADVPGAFRVQDLNGDGSQDIITQGYQTAEWRYLLNDGTGKFDKSYCLLNTGGTSCLVTWPNSNGLRRQILLQDFDGDMKSDLWVSEIDPVGQLSGEAVRTRVYRWKGGAGSDPYSTCTENEEEEVGPGPGYGICTESDFAHAIYASGSELGGAGDQGLWTYAIGGNTEQWSHLITDLDADSHPDSLTWKFDADQNSRRFFLQRSTDHHEPRDLLVGVTNGNGMRTDFHYGLLSQSSVHTRDNNGYRLNDYGRGSEVFDLRLPTFVVRRMDTPAPVTGNLGLKASMLYRYQGMKLQAGGRGGLGFRKVYSFNLQNRVETVTEYAQRFPLTGMPLATESRALSPSNAQWILACDPDTAGGGCYDPPPLCASGACPHFSGLDANPATRGQILARSTNTPVWRLRSTSSPDHGAENAPLQAGTPAIAFVYGRSSEALSYESSTALAGQVISRTLTEFVGPGNAHGYDRNGNVLHTRVQHYAGSSTLQQTETSFSEYATDNESIWMLGRLSRTTVTRVRPGVPELSRVSEFAYDGNGQLKTEILQPQNTAQRLVKHTERHRYGMPSIEYSCSKPVEDQGRCTSAWQTGVQVSGGSDPFQWSYRYGETVYDPVTGLPTEVHVLRNNAGTPVRERASQTVYNRWGAAQQMIPNGGAESTITFDAFGRPVHTYTATGAQSSALLDWCAGINGGTVSCPAGAVVRATASSPAGPTTWVYSDGLGRELFTLAQSLRKNEYSVVATRYDGLGRKVYQSEPVITTVGPATASSLQPGAHSTETCYDVGNRVTIVKLPNHVQGGAGFSCGNLPTPQQLTDPLPNTTNISQTIYEGLSTTTINGLGQSQKVTVNAMGETVASEDALFQTTSFHYDAYGNLLRVAQVDGAQTTMEYDELGRRRKMVDPDAGTRYTVHNAAGEVVREIDGKGQCLQNVRDFNGRIARAEEYPSSTGTYPGTLTCAGAMAAVTTTEYDTRKLGLPTRTHYGTSDAATNQGAVRTDMHYDNFGRAVSMQRCVVAVSLNRSDARNCKLEQSAYDQYGRSYWSADASSEGLVHGTSVYQTGLQRGARMHYSEAGTQITVAGQNVELHAGFLFKASKLEDAAVTYYEVQRVDARGQVREERMLGTDTFRTVRTYEASTGRLTGLQTGSLQALGYQYDELGNLRLRTDDSEGRNIAEEFAQYDALNRVRTAALYLSGSPTAAGTLAMNYGPTGNLIQKDGGSSGPYAHSTVSGYVYGSLAGQHGVNGCQAGSLHAVGATSDTLYCYDNNGNQLSSRSRANGSTQRLIQYTLFDKPHQIDSLEVGGPGHSTRYGYGPAREMAWRIDIPQNGGAVANASVEVQYYGSVERELRRGSGSQVQETWKRNVLGFLQITEQRTVDDSAGSTSYGAQRSDVLLKDGLGSTHLIVKSDGTDRQYMRFDVWGLRADPGTGSTLTLPQAYAQHNPNDPAKTRTRDGYTGHEMVDGAGIVHMQGRIYDPRLGRFLQADPIIQDPLNAQNYNRYTYVYNNPLSLTDPSGYRSLSANIEMYWKPAAAIVILVATQQYVKAAKIVGAAALGHYAAAGAVAGYLNSGTLRGAAMGALDAVISFGIGQYAPTWLQPELHGLKGGVLAKIEGEHFGHGFLTAYAHKIAGVGIDSISGLSDNGKYLLQALAGGTISRASGGSFANGAVSAVLQFAFNQLGQPIYGEPDPNTVRDDVRVDEWLRSLMKIEVDSSGNHIKMSMRVPFNAGVSATDELVQEFENSVESSLNQKVEKGLFTKRSIEIAVDVYRAAPGELGLFTLSHCRSVCQGRPTVQGAWLERIRTIALKQGGRSGYGGHEFLHFMGLGHQRNNTKSFMSYHFDRRLRYSDLKRIYDAYSK